jgi:hypothetical protein
MTAVHDYHELHELIDQLEPEQADELMQHAQRLAQRTQRRFRVLRTFDGPATDLGARAREIIRAEIGEADASR